MRSKEGLTLSPKMSFVLGLVGGILVLCTIGFFVLLAVVLKGTVSLKSVDDANSAKVVDTNPAPVPSQPSPSPAEQVGEVKAVSAADHVRGDKNAPVTIIEYSDFECPFCQRFHTTMKELMADSAYAGKVKWVFRNFPLSFHANAMPAAIAAECAGLQNKFWEFADKAYESQSQLGDALFAQIASDLKLNKSKFDSCIKDKSTQAKINDDKASGSAAGVTGTPGSIILGADGSKQLVPGALPVEEIKSMLDPVLKK